MDGDQPVGVAGTGDRSERLERFLDYQVHPVAWVLLAAAVVALLIYVPAGGLSFLNFRATVAAIGPLLFAAALLLTASGRRRLVLGAVAFALPSLLDLTYRLLDLGFPALRPVDFLDVPRSFGGLLTFAGLLMIGRAIGGVRSQRGRALIAAFGVVAVAVIAWQLTTTIDLTGLVPPPSEGGPLLFVGRPPEMIIGALGRSVWLGWGYLLASALDQRLRWLVAGAALTTANLILDLAVTIWIVLMPPPAPPDTTLFDLIALIETALIAGSFACLIVSAFVELKGAGWAYPLEESASR
jgi:hypothetical protein